ncbi:MAG: histidinol dehydrogenase, partial [Clostridia bacterium]|nr:histidinol dehydrogenase [Clostridia bacterium]
MPDTLVWRGRMTYNEPMIEVYFRHPSYNDYPVVGVSWVQANNEPALRAVKDDVIKLAETEGLTAHANAVKVRFEN